MSDKKWVYLFDQVDEAEERAGDWESVRGLLGGKGANLGEMTRIGVPVPPGFTVTTEACIVYQDDQIFPEGMWDQVMASMRAVEEKAGKKFGDPTNPLLVSCRSGAKMSMPGMMDTVLNIGLNDETAKGMIELTQNARFVFDSYRRLVQMFGSVVLGIPDEAFEDELDSYKAAKSVQSDTDLDAEDWKYLTEKFKAVVKKEMGFDFPQEPEKQLELAIKAVFNSWNGKRAVDYRRRAGIPDDLGTAVNIQTMVFGNMGWDSGTGVAFTRDPGSGEKKLYGDFLLNAQGEDVVAGIRNTEPISQLADEMPDVYRQFEEITLNLENHYHDMQDVEFTIEKGKLWMLQTRSGKRTAKAAIKVAVDMVNEGLIDRKEAVLRVDPEHVDQMLHPQFDPEIVEEARNDNRLLASGVNASPGAAVGQVYFDADTAEKMAHEEGQDVIMVRPFTKPDDVHGMLAAKGILTSEGGATSHAAVVARQFGVPCVVGASMMSINLEKRELRSNGKVIKEGDWISLDGSSGEAYIGKLDLTTPDLEEQKELMTLLDWADENSRLEVWVNADYPADAIRARSFGAKGIGLCRTEHMFFEEERLPHVEKMIINAEEAQKLIDIAERLEASLETGRFEGRPLTDETRKMVEAELAEAKAALEGSKAVKAYYEALDVLLPLQRGDFYGLFEAMDGLPVIIRLIDPPLHEFLPSQEDLLVDVTTMRLKGEKDGLEEKEILLDAVNRLHESNPMMGLRGIRLGIVYPDIMRMQVRAIFEAASEAAQKGFVVYPEIMIPLTGHINELKSVQPELEAIAKSVMAEKNVNFNYKFGTMIEIPRAALTAGEIAEVAEFFSFGTNDLTQMGFGYSRDDAERNFLFTYVDKGILPVNPFQVLDRKGIGRLMELAVKEGREVRPDLEVGICGEHGGDPSSIEFCHLVGNNYVSCSPFRVPVARLAAAHANIKNS
ncbi:MAG TPA: pyruvate, phosphate dikinase [Brevefilum fermentans]|jgi:pyruvate,orthophosphate dikinase|uniref:Pyruvate, phosphate dikinase n=1 Tax=Candidatus Brevifilum fermentans TaxID=1986204 RepID=A0A1Y6K512_9CHLR|nr:pyruvate, phosphate dikinase [Brevefilum fermentans]MDI9565644.1 pyruvate, phosphate dikinase [Chloroflexota bacterium]SMX54792.1 Pyruvate, phosphate dikinase 2 [Brevefilum fermentans]HOM66472.1 pyruvate, phosphate dikinase [Brevefilum fermentans]HQA28265.1 pyruvate, phosphate dikinase [Brevefilum fermentans]